jgi:hypothetical protein
MLYIFSFLLEFNTKIWHVFLVYFIGIIVSNYCKTPQKIIFLAFSIFNFTMKSKTPLLFASRSWKCSYVDDMIVRGFMMCMSFVMDGNRQERKQLTLECKALKWVKTNNAPHK